MMLVFNNEKIKPLLQRILTLFLQDDFFSGALEDNIRTAKETTAGSSKLLDGIQENLSNDFGDSFERKYKKFKCFFALRLN